MGCEVPGLGGDTPLSDEQPGGTTHLGELSKALRALAIHARLRLIPHLRDDNLAPLAWHIRGITALAIAFVVVGAGIRLGGFG